MKVLVNAVSAKLGGAATYVRNLVRSLEEQAAPQDRFVVVVPPERAAEMAHAGRLVRVIASSAASGSYAGRWWWDQVTLRRLISREKPDVLFSSANFAMLSCPCPQALLVRIPIYFAREYLEHVLPEKGAGFRVETAMRRWLVCRSVAGADYVVTPSAAMLSDLQRFVNIPDGRTRIIPYGVPRARIGNDHPAPAVASTNDPLRLLWVSHYADHKNLATLLRAVELLRERGNRPVELRLTLEPPLKSGQRGEHTPLREEERGLLAALDGTVRYLGVLGYEATWKEYREAGLFAFPSLCESFGHPLVEAMAAGRPIVASDIPVHREICGEAAAYFPARDAAALAERLAAIGDSRAFQAEMIRRGRKRVHSFIWESHVEGLLTLLRELATPRGAGEPAPAPVA